MELFDAASKVQPSVIFFDEIDGTMTLYDTS
jgi:ATP-dependent 26S proteasome regulatory subunit